MSIVSDTDLWMYVSSSGGLTAGRNDEDHALFPYETDDRLHNAGGMTGPFTLLRVQIPERAAVLWQPFSNQLPRPPVRRNLYKSVLGNQIVFEEIHTELGLTFRYRWRNSDEFGFVRTCSLQSDREQAVSVDILDGLLNILPAGVDLVTHQRASCLINAYTQIQLDPATGLGIFSMSSQIVDKAQAADSLIANTVWSSGLPAGSSVLLSPDQIQMFVANKTLQTESGSRGKRGAYLVTATLKIPAGGEHRWNLVADAARDQFAVEALRRKIRTDRTTDLESSTDRASQSLLGNLASADGLQLTADRLACHHHLANVLFNNMRGGVFADNGLVDATDLRRAIQQRNKKVATDSADFFDAQNARQSITAWLAAAEREQDPDLTRLCYEYLPITFSRRHGDPSRPWNRFQIAVKDSDGKPILNYQGNWRDIFQNWEALCTSFPQYIHSVIAKFVNASTMDGFNPYRITRAGGEWEKPDPQDPWANIGYWGDHQIVYLLRLLELSRNYHGPQLGRLLEKRIFTYTHVPYRIKPYAQLVIDRWNTIEFDAELDRQIQTRLDSVGADARLVRGRDGKILHVTLLEKLLVPLLAKLSNLVVDAGIWMNTQRPEWNDANNALVGNGISMVTLYHMRRYVNLLKELVTELQNVMVFVSQEVVVWLGSILQILRENLAILDHDHVSDHARRVLLDQLGQAFCDYRSAIHANGLSQPVELGTKDIEQMLKASMKYLDHAVQSNRRPDGLYHAYNLATFSPGSLKISRLPLMLEGQVAVLSSGALNAGQACEVIGALFQSPLYRADQFSFMLYPDRVLPGFLQSNIIPEPMVSSSPLLRALVDSNNRTLIQQDPAGQFRFCGSPRNQTDVQQSLDRLAADPKWTDVLHEHRQSVLEIYESVVHHHAFTGRSGAMFGYEGLGCIYWHMVSKLLLAVQECFWSAVASRDSASADQLRDLYNQVRRGLSFNKSADQYGAIPLDPYSHTPGHAGAQQPGMTGQVKEEILTRAGELGVRVRDGQLHFCPQLLKSSEFLSADTTWKWIDVAANHRELSMPMHCIGFTVCQTPIRLHLQREPSIRIAFSDHRIEVIQGSILPHDVSQCIFNRSGHVDHIDVFMPPTDWH